MDEPTETAWCRDCRGEVHPEATRCRHCGFDFDPPWYRTTWGSLVAGGLVGFGILAAGWVFVLVLTSQAT
jgi:hypothetical protein